MLHGPPQLQNNRGLGAIDVENRSIEYGISKQHSRKPDLTKSFRSKPISTNQISNFQNTRQSLSWLLSKQGRDGIINKISNWQQKSAEEWVFFVPV